MQASIRLVPGEPIVFTLEVAAFRDRNDLGRLLRKLEAPILAFALGAIPPIAGLLAGWWGSLPWNSETWIARFAFAGLAMGLLIDAIFLRGFFRRRYAINWLVWLGIFVFYSVGMFGFFMGVPAFNVALALPAGLVVGGKLAASNCDSDCGQRIILRACISTTMVLTAVCVASATIALLHPSTASELQHMLNLGFEVTTAHLVSLIIVGGGALLVMHWTITAFVARRTWQAWLDSPGRLSGSMR
jgi:hypothetical protein